MTRKELQSLYKFCEFLPKVPIAFGLIALAILMHLEDFNRSLIIAVLTLLCLFLDLFVKPKILVELTKRIEKAKKTNK
jgi:hypothetical protein